MVFIHFTVIDSLLIGGTTKYGVIKVRFDHVLCITEIKYVCLFNLFEM